MFRGGRGYRGGYRGRGRGRGGSNTKDAKKDDKSAAPKVKHYRHVPDKFKRNSNYKELLKNVPAREFHPLDAKTLETSLPIIQYNTDPLTGAAKYVQDLLFNTSCNLKDFVDALQKNREWFVSEFLIQLHLYEISYETRLNTLLAAFQLKDTDVIKLLLSDITYYDFPEVFAAVRCLDADRRIKQLTKLTKDMTAAHDVRLKKWNAEQMEEEKDVDNSRGGRGRGRGGRGGRGNRTTTVSTTPPPRIGKQKQSERAHSRSEALHKSKLQHYNDELKSRMAEKIPGLTATLSGHNTSFFREWAKNVQEPELRLYIMVYGLEAWTEFSDLVHISPASMKCPSFLGFAHNPGGAGSVNLPKDVQFALNFHANVNTNLQQIVAHKVPFDRLKKSSPPSTWSDITKKEIASYMDLSSVFRNIDELTCSAVETVIKERLSRGETVKFGYGKLLEKLLSFNLSRNSLAPAILPLANQMLGHSAVPLKTPIAIVGDVSASMGDAVKPAALLAGLLSLLTAGDLYYFNKICLPPPITPENVTEVLMCMEETKSSGTSSPAAALEPLYLNKKKAETIVLITAEQEDESGPLTGMVFSQLLKLYKEEISPSVNIVLISFLRDQDPGYVASILASCQIPFVQCRMDFLKPDLSKLDRLFGKLVLETSSHTVAVSATHLYLSFMKNSVCTAAQEIKKFTAAFVRQGIPALFTFVKTCFTTAPLPADDGSNGTVFADSKELLISLFGLLHTSDPIVAAIAHIVKLDNFASLKKWMETEWNSTFMSLVEDVAFTRVDSASETNQPMLSEMPAGTATPLPHELLNEVFEYLKPSTLRKIDDVCPKFARVSRETKFFQKFKIQPQKYEAELETIREMGLLEMFNEDVAMDTLKHTNGNVAHCIALLMGEGKK